jgi:translocation and assembly module TamA
MSRRRSSATAGIGAFLVALMLSQAASVSAAEAPPSVEPQAKYTVRYEGVKDDLRALIESVSRLKTFENRSPPTVSGIERRAKSDMDNINEALRSEGYYDGHVSYAITGEQTPVRVTVTIDPGQEYVLTEFNVRYVDADRKERPKPEGAESVMAPLGVRARAPTIVADEAQLIESLTRHGYPYAQAVDRKVVVDHRTRTVSVTLDVEPGPLGRFGDVTVEGLTTLKTKFVVRRTPWKTDDIYDADLLDEYRTKLATEGLFQSISVEKAAEPTADGHVPIEVSAVEAKHRSIGGTIGYSTSEHLGGTVFWENRNLLGNGQRLRITGEASELRQGVTGDFLVPDFLRFNQNLKVTAAALHENTDAYESTGASGLVALDRALAKNLRASLGVSTEVTQIKDDTGKELFQLFGSPATLRYDSRDNVLDAHKGVRAALSMTPYISFGNGHDIFLVSEFNGSVYFPITSDRYILALRTRLGSITGSSTERIPASKRFYAGGGGSIRGFNYQRVGPLDANGDPVGGRSVAEVGAEIRARVSQAIGLVPFVEGGNVYDSVYPDFSEKFRWAAGLGVRYHTAVGPLRFDLAFPLNRRPGVDNHFEFYISIGQAF